MREWIRIWTENVETFVLEVITEQRRDKKAAVVRFGLFLLSKVFAVAVKVRRFLYNVRILRDSTLGVQVIAEGIETPYQLDVVRKLGCQYGQGFLFSRPIPPERITREFLERPIS